MDKIMLSAAITLARLVDKSFVHQWSLGLYTEKREEGLWEFYINVSRDGG